MKFKRTAMALLLSSLTAGVAFAQSAPAPSGSGAPFGPDNPPQPSDCEQFSDSVSKFACATVVTFIEMGKWTQEGLDQKADKAEVTKLKENTIEALKELATAAIKDDEKLDAKIDAVDNKLSNKADKSALDVVDKKLVDVSTSAVKAEKASEDNTKSISALEGKVEKKLNTSEFEEFKGKLKEAALKTAEKIDEMFNEKADKSALDAKVDNQKLDTVKKLLDDKIEAVAISTYRLDRDIENHADVLDDHADRIEELQENKADKSSLENAKKQIANVAISTYRLDREIDKLKENDAALVFAALETAKEIDKLTEEKADKSSLDVVKKQLANVAISTYQLDRDIENHADVLDDHADRIEELQEHKADISAVTNIAVALDTVGQVVNMHSDAIVAQGEDIENLKETTNSQVTAIASATAAAKAASDEAKVAKLAADAVESTATSAKAEATAAKSVADNARTIATTAEGKADANAGKITTLEGGYATLVTTTNTLNTQVRDLDARVKANTDRINQLDLRVENVQKEMRRGLAAQAALSGLFQPYTVGKANITAAVGGYKSQTALAVGAGYRFNAKFAAKAGLALNTSGRGMAYNVAVNYEF